MSKLLEEARAAAAANKLADQTEDSGGGFEYVPPAEGACVARLVSYIEIGKMPQRPFGGKEKKPAPECILEFQLLGKKHAKEIEVEDENGQTTKKTVYPIMRIGRGPSASGGEAVGNGMTMPGGNKSNHYKLLQALDYGRGNNHMALMVGEGFKLNIVHNEVEKEVNGKKTKMVYANLRDKNGAWQVFAPTFQKFDDMGEPVGGPQQIQVPPATVEEKLFLQDAPSMNQWNSLYIPGTYNKKVDGKEVEVSKNWIQETIKNSVSFEGSAVQSMLAEFEGDLPTVETDPDAGAESGSVSDAPDPEEEAPEIGDDAAQPPENGAEDEDDPLAVLGL